MTTAELMDLREHDPGLFAQLDAQTRKLGIGYVRNVGDAILSGARDVSIESARATMCSALHSALYGASPDRAAAGPQDEGIRAVSMVGTSELIRYLWAAIGQFSADLIRLGAALPKLEAHGELAQSVSLDIGAPRLDDGELLATSKQCTIPPIISARWDEIH